MERINWKCLFGNDWWWSRGKSSTGDFRTVAHCIRCGEFRGLSPKNWDMHDMKEVRNILGIPSWSPIYFQWENIPFEMDEKGNIKSVSN